VPRKKPPPRPKDLRRAVLDASLVLLEEGGVGALSMREVARRARVTHGAPYHHFADRAAILAALAEEGFQWLAREMSDAMSRAPRGSLKRLEECARGYFHFAIEHPAYMKIMFRPELAEPASHPAVDAAAGEAMRLLIECVVECQLAGTMLKGDSLPIVLTTWATMHGLASLWLDGPLCRLGQWPGSPEALAHLVAHTLSSWIEAASGSPTGRP
jgi:AcrR family transcriptional regulator